MANVYRSDRAEGDLVDLLVHLRRHSPKAADRFEADFEKRCWTLAQFPLTGRSREELAPGLRSSLVKPYVVFYRPLDDGILIVRILHGARDHPREFDD